MKRKHINRLIAGLLIFSTLLSVVCLPSFAEDAVNIGKDTENLSAIDPADQIPQDVTIVSEDISRRKEFEKHYLLSDGTYLATTYAEAVHFKDDNGVWQNIDTTFTYDSESESYKTNDNGFSAEFSTENSHVKLKNKDHNELSWHYELIGTDNEKAVMKLQKKNAKAQKKQNKTAAGKSVTDTDTFALPNIKSELAFDSAFASFGADIRYTVSAQKIKEDVILNEKGKVYALEMVVENCAYTATLSENGSVIFFDKTGKEYFYIDPPYMYDSQGNGSDDIDVSINQTGKKVIVTYTPSKAWLDSSERVYPVTFDPAVTTSNYTLNIHDTYVESGVSSNDAEIATNITLGPENAAYYIITNIPYTGHLPVISASLTLTATTMSSGLAGAQLKLSEIDPNVYFDLPEIEYGTGIHLDTQSIIGNNVIAFDVTSIALLEACSRTGTNGLCYRLRLDKHTMQFPNETISFGSVEHATASKRPVFTLRYGYENPENLISENANDDDNRYWITNTNALSYGRKMLWTGNNFLTDYSTNKPRGHFNFTVDSSDPYGMYIYGCYDERYVSAPKTASGSVTSGSICIESLANATQWIAIRLSHATYAFVLKDAPSMALTRSGSTVKVQQVSSALSEAQEWLVYSTSNSDATEAIDTHPLEEGTYYINSYSSRKFMVNTSTENTAGLILTSSTVGQFGRRMAWDVSFIGNGKYMIQSRWNKKYLSVTKDSVSLIEIENEDNIPAEALFTVGITGSNYTLRSGAGYYLTTKSTGLGSSSGGSETKWRLCLVDRYTELNSCQIRTLTLDETEAIPLQLGPNNAVFSTLSDFNFITDTTLVSISGTDITANGIGEFAMQVHHIPTGRMFSCSVLVEAVYMYLVSTPAFFGGGTLGGESTGHAFLYFENKTAQTVTVGHSILQPGDGMSVGKFGQSPILPGYDGSSGNGCREGIWYNAEIKQYYATGRFDNVVAICNALTLSELKNVSEYICVAELTDDDDYQLLSNNCTHFAIGAWDTVFESTFSGIWTPGGLADEIEEEDSYISDLAFYSNSEQYGYYDDEN